MSFERLRIERTEIFDAWFDGLTDDLAFGAILKRIERLALGNAGDVAPVGEGVSELRVHVGAGWRVYYVRRGDAYVLLCGGSKRSQSRDIERAKSMASEF